MDREQELALLIKEQAADMARGDRQPRESFVECSLEEVQTFYESNGKFPSAIGYSGGCSLHGFQDSFLDEEGKFRCRVCRRDNDHNPARQAVKRAWELAHLGERRAGARDRMRTLRAARKAEAQA